jgi:hypothetical protein
MILACSERECAERRLQLRAQCGAFVRVAPSTNRLRVTVSHVPVGEHVISSGTISSDLSLRVYLFAAPIRSAASYAAASIGLMSWK